MGTHFCTSEQPKRYNFGHTRKIVSLSIIFWTIYFLRFGTELYRQSVCIPMGTNCTPLVITYLFLFYYERNFMLSLSDYDRANVIEIFNSNSRYLDDLLDNPYF